MRACSARRCKPEKPRIRARTGSSRLSRAGEGSVEVDGVRIDARDGAAIRDVATITVKALSDAEVVLVDSR
jgi:hypothetical protein